MLRSYTVRICRSGLALLVGWMLVISASARGATPSLIKVFDNFGPDNTFVRGGIVIGTTVFDDLLHLGATSFQVSQGGYLRQMQFGMQGSVPADAGTYNFIVLSLRSDTAGAPGAILWQAEIPSLATPSTPFGLIADTFGVYGPYLDPGVKYWMVAQNPDWDRTSSTSWWRGLGSATNSEASSRSNGTWSVTNNTQGRAIRVLVEVPEPAAAVLGLAVVGLSVRGRASRRR